MCTVTLPNVVEFPVAPTLWFGDLVHCKKQTNETVHLYLEGSVSLFICSQVTLCPGTNIILFKIYTVCGKGRNLFCTQKSKVWVACPAGPALVFKINEALTFSANSWLNNEKRTHYSCFV